MTADDDDVELARKRVATTLSAMVEGVDVVETLSFDIRNLVRAELAAFAKRLPGHCQDDRCEHNGGTHPHPDGQALVTYSALRCELAAFAERMPHPMEKTGPRPSRDPLNPPGLSDEAIARLRESLEATTAEMLAKAGVRLDIAGLGAEAPKPAATPTESGHDTPDDAVGKLVEAAEAYMRLAEGPPGVTGWLRDAIAAVKAMRAETKLAATPDDEAMRIAYSFKLSPFAAEELLGHIVAYGDRREAAARADERRRTLEEAAQVCDAERELGLQAGAIGVERVGLCRTLASRIRALASGNGAR